MSENSDTIKFGTDGWRAVIAQGYTFANLRRVSQAASRWLLKQGDAQPTAVVGHDTRFLGRSFAEMTARVLASNGIRVLFADGATLTPAISWATKEYGSTAGFVITASHNPARYNGFKIKGSFGGSALPEMVAAVESEITDDDEGFDEIPGFADAVDSGMIELRDIRRGYIDSLRRKINVDLIRTAGLRVVHDAMYGAGQGVLKEILGEEYVDELHASINPSFGGTPPEPIENNLEELSREVVSHGCSAGIANDGDADRIGMYDEHGHFVDSHRLLALLVRYLHEDQGLGGTIVKTLSTTDMLDSMAAQYGLEIHTTPIGFKYIGGYILENDVLVGGEESGGMTVKGHIPDRDGIYIGLLILEMMARRGKYLSSLVDDLFEDFGVCAYDRVDVHTSEEKKQAALAALENSGGLRTIDGKPVGNVDRTDGFKHRTETGWLLVRASGTEPVLRIYSEDASLESARRNIADAISQLKV
jgi:phosphomannomutase